MKSIWQFISNWWHNQKWVILSWLPPAIDNILEPMIEKEIDAKKKDIINALNTYSAHDNAVKACSWIKDRLAALLP